MGLRGSFAAAAMALPSGRVPGRWPLIAIGFTVLPAVDRGAAAPFPGLVRIGPPAGMSGR